MFRAAGIASAFAFTMLGFLGLVQADNSDFSFVGGKAAAANHVHHNGHDLVKDKLKTDGKHQLHMGKHHTAHAHVQGGKVSKVSAHDAKNKDLTVHKVKSSKKHHAMLENGTRNVYVSVDGADVDEDCNGIIWVGYQIIIIGFPGQPIPPPVIYWFPSTIIIGGTDDCSNYDGGGCDE